MTDIALELNDEDILNYDISDAALETAAGTIIAGHYTFGMCTGVTECPGSKRLHKAALCFESGPSSNASV